uniref:LR gamma4 n=1 Tax=Griffithsia pacifica TaxID=35689 RepID=A0A291FEE7_GRIPA|nr:Chain 34, LR_gamma4 [Griffithsia pacifica]5Y6P_A2 Chain A2, LR_gamma4 [Griffithsia pacifica]5Y6P_U8 Chain U8, LR_gamma4 [Griffithsia pacifica]5Y6P_Y5 Chain Y5, LR_gamma4 [Griffithsia pacifica]5Y6P_Z9 Chain Z9, LR_gamma4 [Griffithsia pacifica]5Y6P_a3 Chain a3, LR_gamma4 [Griffithsia pacifica]5Y6P_aY Chain aY, LR_gamma4 [Griffithsia pacifica]5Y6P_b8 Chain b8, LR_gamma4 [Griffithsia pacifica]5Y6P_b9 Chain b9, LR_gamma4 [Griffithsia pacifica]5Y6P_bY Chain bY, LR_gamma4 [Griffithsia pacifica
MDSPAFAVNGMFSAVKVGNSSFTENKVTAVSKTAPTASVRMVVDPFQRKFQSIGKIGIDYSRPKKLATYKRVGYSVGLDFPNAVSMAGHYSLTDCTRAGGAAKILMKYDEYCAKGMLQVYKRSAVSTGVYTTKCTEATQPGVAYDVRVFNRTAAFRQAQKPVNVRLGEQYAARKACVTLAHNCSREEAQFKNMPMSCATFLAGKMEAMGTCYRTVRPSSKAEDYMAGSVRMQVYQKGNASGVYPVGGCEDGHAKGDADLRRVIALASEYRAAQQGAAAVTGAQYASSKMAIQLYGHSCNHEEGQFCDYPAVAAAMCRY